MSEFDVDDDGTVSMLEYLNSILGEGWTVDGKPGSLVGCGANTQTGTGAAAPGADSPAEKVSRLHTELMPRSPAELFKQLDSNGDGHVSLDELEAKLKGRGIDSQLVSELFAKLDRSHDGAPATHASLPFPSLMRE